MTNPTTPGPWRKTNGVGAIEIRGEPTADVPNPRVCRVLRVDPNCEGNADLIAAAPAMLAMLLMIAQAGRQPDVGMFPTDYGDVLAAIDSLIAQATGGQP